MAEWTKFNGSRKSRHCDDLGMGTLGVGKLTVEMAKGSDSGVDECVPKENEASSEEWLAGGGRSSYSSNGSSRERIYGPAEVSEMSENSTGGIITDSIPIAMEAKDGSESMDDEEDHKEDSSILRRASGNDEPGSRIRAEAQQELKEISLKRPVSLYREDQPVSPKNIAVYDSSERVCLSGIEKNGTTTENSTEKLVNGRSPREDKQVLHVQFNRDTKQQQPHQQSPAGGSRGDGSHPSPSISTSTTSSSSEDNSSLDRLCETRPPDGGWGWVVVAASFMVNLIADGITFSFGVIFVEFLNYFNESKSKTAWIGSLFMSMPLLSGPVASFLTDRYGCRRVTIAGSILATTGFVISSYANSMGVLIFTFGVVAGFGLSLCFVAAVVIVAYYFDKKRSFATGLSVCGSGIGTFIFAPVTHYLLAEYGWRGTTLILAGLFFNLAVCGCLMRDLEWTTTRAKAKTEERKKIREKKRSRIQGSSADSFSASSSGNTATQMAHGADQRRNFASANAMIINNLRQQDDVDEEKQFSSLVNLPTFVKNGERVPLEVLELLSTRKNLYNVLVHNYPSLQISSRSCSDSGAFHDQPSTPSARFVPTPSPLAELKKTDKDDNLKDDQNTHRSSDVTYLWWLKKVNREDNLRQSCNLEHPRRLPTAYLKDIRVHRHSLTYRGAMLNINRYRLRASSCPDIYRNSMTTIAKTKMVWYAGLWEFWDLLVDMLDFSHFANSKFLFFSISNFLLHTWYDVPYVYLTDNAIEMGYSETDGSILISIIGIANMVGEISLGWAGDRSWINPSFVYAICMALCGAVTALIPVVVDSYYLLCTVAGAFGLFIAANYSLTSIILVELITLERFTNAYGLLLLVQGIANLMGPPLAGWLYDITGKYNLSFYLAGFFIALSGVMLLANPVISWYKRCKHGPNKESEDAEFSAVNNV